MGFQDRFKYQHFGFLSVFKNIATIPSVNMPTKKKCQNWLILVFYLMLPANIFKKQESHACSKLFPNDQEFAPYSFL
jgi:hypothetical protein